MRPNPNTPHPLAVEFAVQQERVVGELLHRPGLVAGLDFRVPRPTARRALSVSVMPSSATERVHPASSVRHGTPRAFSTSSPNQKPTTHLRPLAFVHARGGELAAERHDAVIRRQVEVLAHRPLTVGDHALIDLGESRQLAPRPCHKSRGSSASSPGRATVRSGLSCSFTSRNAANPAPNISKSVAANRLLDAHGLLFLWLTESARNIPEPCPVSQPNDWERIIRPLVLEPSAILPALAPRAQAPRRLVCRIESVYHTTMNKLSTSLARPRSSSPSISLAILLISVAARAQDPPPSTVSGTVYFTPTPTASASPARRASPVSA